MEKERKKMDNRDAVSVGENPQGLRVSAQLKEKKKRPRQIQR